MSKSTLPIVFAVLIACASGPAALAQPVADDDPRPTLIVTGRGEVTMQPDRAIVSLGVVAESAEAAAAQERVNEVMTDVIDAITDLDIPRNKLSTSNLSLQPIYSRVRPDIANQEPQITGYRASYTLSVVVDEIDAAGDVVDAGLNAGANQLQGVQFTLQDDVEARLEALRQASADAESKAAVIAGAMGVELDHVKRITEAPQFMPYPTAGVRVMSMEAASPIEAGELTITAQLTVEYVIAQD